MTTRKKTESNPTREIDARQIALENAVAKSGLDEIRYEVADLTDAVRALKAAFDNRAVVVALSILIGALTVVVALLIYYVLVSGPAITRLHQLEHRVDLLTPAATSTTTTTSTTTPTTRPITTPPTRANPPQSPQSPANGSDGVGTAATSTTTSTTSRPPGPSTTCVTTRIVNVCR